MEKKSESRTKRKQVTDFNETPKERRKRHARLLALFKSPLFTEDVEEQRKSGKALQKALAESNRK